MSKWANRLKGALAKTEVSEVCLDSALTITDKTHQKVVSSAFVSGQSRDYSKNSILRRDENPSEKINLCLNSALTKTDETEIKTQIVRLDTSSFVKVTVAKTQEIKFQNTELERTTADSAVVESPTLTHRLNAMIAAGVSFDVGPDSFQTFGASERENIFLRENGTAILCTLHQSLLMKYLPLDYIVPFTDEINERTAILSDGATIEPPFKIVAEVSREWFIGMSEELLKI